MQHFINRLIPFILLGIALVAFAAGIVLLAYLFFIGACIGLFLFALSWLKAKFFPTKTPTKTQKRSGRTIDSDDWKKM